MPDFSVDTQDLINGAVLGVLHIGGLLRLGFALGIGTAYIELTTTLNRLSERVDALEAENRSLKKRISKPTSGK